MVQYKRDDANDLLVAHFKQHVLMNEPLSTKLHWQEEKNDKTLADLLQFRMQSAKVMAVL